MGYKKIQISKMERFNWLKLSQSKNVGAHTFDNLLSQYGSATKALEYLRSFKPELIAPDKDIEALVKGCAKNDVAIVLACDDEYPQNLREVKYTPPLIFVKGDLEICKNTKIISQVGARNASIPAKQFAMALANDLAEQGYVIASGMARGIDTASHKGALIKGKTVAIIAGGIDHIYPKENKDLYWQIIENGCVISEHPVGFTPQVQHFAKRNRLIAGIAKGLVVMEAKENSGSLITANFALDYGREVFAMPGSPMDSRNYGCNKLIQQGAHLVQNSSDITEALAYKQQSINLDYLNEKKLSEYALQEEVYNGDVKNIILQNLSYSPTHIDELIANINTHVKLVLQALVDLELEDKIIRNGDEVTLAFAN